MNHKENKKQDSFVVNSSEEDPLILIDKIAKTVISKGKFELGKNAVCSKESYVLTKKRIIAYNLKIPPELASKIKIVDEIAVKKNKKEFIIYLFVPGIFILFLGIAMYFLVGSIFWIICCGLITIEFIWAGLERLKKANNMIKSTGSIEW